MSESQPSALKIVVVGGGSVNWAPKLVRDVLAKPTLRRLHFVLLDIDKAAAERVKAFATRLAEAMGVRARFTATDRPAAMAGANYIIIAISTGGLDAMAHDLAIPEKFGVYHTVGDTSGPGGWARTIRNFETFVALADQFNRHAPDALILNYTNPMATLTDVLARRCPGRVVGLCHGLFENIALLQHRFGLEHESDLSADYAGLNHFFWMTRITGRGRDLLADLRRQVESTDDADALVPVRFTDGAGHGSAHRRVAAELLRTTGVLPYLGDRHTCEFFPWYITSRERMRRYKLVRTSIAERRRRLTQARKRFDEMTRRGIPDAYLERSRETAADIIEAHATGPAFIDVGNVPNVGQIDNVPRGPVVETAVRVDGNGFAPIHFGPLPDVIAGWIEPYAYSYRLTVDACFERDRRKAIAALRLDPVCAHLDTPRLTDLATQLLAAHRRFITAF